MIIVCGARRSGTSMWMQILAAAGLPVIGDPFPLDWERSLVEANPRGFYESSLRDGIYFATNPDPRTGQYLHPDETRLHVVKVFGEGLVRTDLSFIDRVLVTIRPWREYAASVDRLYAIENAARGWIDAQRPPRLPAALEWFAINFGIVRDIAMRRYRVHIQAYADVLQRPEPIVRDTLAWLAEGSDIDDALDFDAAVAAVERRTPTAVEAPNDDTSELPPDLLRVLDDFYEAVRAGQGLDTSLLQRMNAAHEQIAPRLAEHQQKTVRWLAERTESHAPAEPLSLEQT